MSTWAIGDVQGCSRTLDRLLVEIRFRPGRDELWFVGDLVNRGPRSLEVLRRVCGLGSSSVAVLGNHDLHLLGLAAGVRPDRPGDTLGPVLAASDRDELLHWLRCRPLLHRRAGFVLVHAGLFPAWSPEEAAREAARLERLLAGSSMPGLLGKDGPQADRPSDARSGEARDRTALHGFTRMRTLRTGGRLDRDFKGPLKDIPRGRVPWFRAPDRVGGDLTVIFGHWSALGLHREPGVVALDSGAAWGGPLSAFRLKDGVVVQVENADG